MNRIIVPAGFALALLSFSIYAQENSIIQKEKIYKEVDGRELKVDIFFAENTGIKTPKPAIAFFHGGGWVFGDPSEFHGACRRYAGKGFVTFSFQYRLSIQEDGSFPHPKITPVESVKDARSAIRWMKENAGDLQVDPDKIAVGGQSAGGQLALSTVLCDDINEQSDNLDFNPVPEALLLYSSNVNTMEAWIDWILGDKREQIWDISPYHNLKKNMPPAIAFHGEADCTVLPYIVELYERKTKELGNSYKLITYPGRTHYLGEGIEKYARYFDEEILERTDEFLIEIGFMKE